MGHVPLNVLKKITSISISCDSTLNHCNICPISRQIRLPFPVSTSRATCSFDLLHMDVWGPYKVPTYDGMKFFLTLVDDHTRWTWIYFMHLKSDVITILEDFIVMVSTKFGKKIKSVRSDNGSEFFNHSCSALLKNFGIVHQSSCSYTP